MPQTNLSKRRCSVFFQIPTTLHNNQWLFDLCNCQLNCSVSIRTNSFPKALHVPSKAFAIYSTAIQCGMDGPDLGHRSVSAAAALLHDNKSVFWSLKFKFASTSATAMPWPGPTKSHGPWATNFSVNQYRGLGRCFRVQMLANCDECRLCVGR